MLSKGQFILGIDTSCDDTSFAILEGCTKRVLSNVVSSQIKIHAEFGGIVPELASRSHLENIVPVFNEALLRAGDYKTELSSLSTKTKLIPEGCQNKISAIAVTKTPGLMGSLLVGTSFARALAYNLQVPLYGINHLDGHLLSPFIDKKPVFPHLGLVVSGGHTAFYKVDSFAHKKLIGQTVDDAAGEAFDKCAKMLGLAYPGGPVIDSLAQNGDDQSFSFTLAKVKMGMQFMSFSGLKTAAYNHILKIKNLNDQIRCDFSASFQKAVVDALMSKLRYFLKDGYYKSFGVSGGVAMNSLLRRQSQEVCNESGITCFIASPQFCTDNGAMIAHVALVKEQKNQLFSLDTQPTKKIQARKLKHEKIHSKKN